MKSIGCRVFAILACLCIGLPGVAAAEDAAGARVVPSTPRLITQPAANQVDNLFETIATPRGFLVTWARSVGSIPPFTLYAQQFDTAGRALGGPVVIDGPGTVGDIVKPVRIDANTIGLVWMALGQVKIAKLDLRTMRVSGKKLLGKSDDHIHDVARLSNGNLAIVTAQIDASNISDIRYKNSLKVISPTFATVKDWTSVHGRGFRLDGWAYLDQAIVAKNSGGIVLYRDHAANTIMMRQFSNAGALGSGPTRINTTAMSAISIVDIAHFEIRAVRLSDGRIAVVWVSLEGGGTDRYEVRGRILAADGTPTGRDFLVHASATGTQAAPEIVALPDGRFTVIWTEVNIIFVSGIRYRTFTSAGRPLFADRTAHTPTALFPFQTESARLGDGSIVDIMQGSGADAPKLAAGGIARPGP